MKELLDMAARAADQAEVYAMERSSDGVQFENGELHDIKGELASGCALRVIKDGRLGFAYARNILSREGLVRNALDSLKGGVEARYDFPARGDLARLDTFDAGVSAVTSGRLVEEGARVADELRSRTGGEIVVGGRVSDTTVRLANSRGLDVAVRSSSFELGGGAIFPGSGSGIFRSLSAKTAVPMPQALLDEIVELFKASAKVVEPAGGRMKVLFMPESMITLAWRLWHGASARSVYEKVSPVASKVGERILSDKISLVDDPLDDARPLARPFDDEGVAPARLAVVEKGVLRGFYNDLHYAGKLGVPPNGRGYRAALWGGDPLELKPTPTLSHLRVEPGQACLRELVGMMDRGLILCEALGPHSGNIPNGDYSVGAAPGLYVERGEIVGRVKEAMVAGNAYETLREVVAVGCRLDPAFGGLFPPVLCDGVSVSTTNPVSGV